ncbi:MAG TPA: plasma-membrane proton-efflux P-type ATPase [Phototrophicaceae bacterium]|nr:plasma-membrane proton-efflux P-type ATPase [Phototrophicaceae bacterium]
MTQQTQALDQRGLSTQEADQRLQQFGPNIIPEQHPHPLRSFLAKFWGLIPFMLELTIVIQLGLGKISSAVIIFLLLVVNGLLSYFQENRAKNALALLRKSLSVQVRVLRDSQWGIVAADAIVPGDVVHLRVGDIIPADMRLFEGEINVDQSALTGESVPVDLAAAGDAYAGSVVRRGEASGIVVNTGQRSKFGKTAELVHNAKTVSHLQQLIQSIIRYLVLMGVGLSAITVIYAWLNHVQLVTLTPFVLILLIGSIPVALPATFTLASALGSQELAARGVLVTRLSAILEAAAMDVLCSDKTGTITRNQLAVAACQPYAPFTEEQLLEYAALASDASTQDPIDLAILEAAQTHHLQVDFTQRTRYTPFDPSTKRTEALVQRDHQTIRVVKGFPATIVSFAADAPDISADTHKMAEHGCRVLAVAVGNGGSLHLVGLLGLQDPPREDSAAIIARLRDLGLRVLMITGDSRATAQAVAQQVGITGAVATSSDIQAHLNIDRSDYEVFSGVFPEDKFKLVRQLQQTGHVVGMTGDGVNDAPALKQAEVGVAVSNATDVAKAAASLVLTTPGLGGMVDAVEVGRRIYQRMLTYTLNRIFKSFQIGLFLTVALLVTGLLVTAPHLVVLLLFANDFVTMSLATDNVTYSRSPDHWDVRSLAITAFVLALAWLVFMFGVLYVGLEVVKLNLLQLQTLVFLLLVFTGQANVYLVRERSYFWRSRPSRWLFISTLVDLIVVCAFALFGILMEPIAPLLILMLFLVTLVYTMLVDGLKVAVFKHLL